MKSRVVHHIILLALFCMVGDQLLAADDIVLRSTVTPDDAWVGQRVELHVEVLAKDGWAQAKKVGDTSIDGAHLLRLESQGVRLSETIDGDSYTGQRYEFLVFTQRDGKFSVPAVPIDVEVRTWGAGGGTEVRRMTLPGVEFAARMPPGAAGIRGLISTTKLTASETWDPEIDSPEIGDAITRTITLKAEDVSGMAFAPLQHSEIEGVGIYPGEPTVDDRFSRGELAGTRIETVTYVFERPGDVDIPGVMLSWWDVGSSELKRIELPGLSVTVVGELGKDSETLAEATREPDRQWLAGLVLAAVVAVAVLLFGRRIAARFANWRAARRESEAQYFQQVVRSARSGDEAIMLRDTMRWLDRINDGPMPARLDEFLHRFGDPDAQATAIELSGLIAARRRWRQSQRVRARVADVLPELNG